MEKAKRLSGVLEANKKVLSQDGARFLRHGFCRKLRSERGASISFALLIFLVCAVMSAVILVAGTTAAGRMKGLAENDQRYYAVTSAAEMIRDMLDEQTVSLLTVGGTDKMYAMPMNQINDSVINSPAAVSVNTDTEGEGGETGTENAPDLNDTAADEGHSDDSFVMDTAGIIRSGTTYTKSSPRKLQLSSSLSADESKDPLAVTIEEAVDENGNLSFVIYNTNGDPFKLMLTFAADSKEIYPPVTKLDAYAITNPREISWHFSKMVSSYDATLQ